MNEPAEPSPHSRTMNTLIAAGFSSKAGTVGTFARTGGTPTPTNSSQRERLSAALDELSAAEKAADEDRIHLASFMVERLRGEAQAGREQPGDEQPGDEQPRNPDGTFAGGFDGAYAGPCADPQG